MGFELEQGIYCYKINYYHDIQDIKLDYVSKITVKIVKFF